MEAKKFLHKQNLQIIKNYYSESLRVMEEYTVDDKEQSICKFLRNFRRNISKDKSTKENQDIDAVIAKIEKIVKARIQTFDTAKQKLIFEAKKCHPISSSDLSNFFNFKGRFMKLPFPLIGTLGFLDFHSIPV
jgi:hypothetical protein